jgi:hypothetical protein
LTYTEEEDDFGNPIYFLDLASRLPGDGLGGCIQRRLETPRCKEGDGEDMTGIFELKPQISVEESAKVVLIPALEDTNVFHLYFPRMHDCNPYRAGWLAVNHTDGHISFSMFHKCVACELWVVDFDVEGPPKVEFNPLDRSYLELPRSYVRVKDQVAGEYFTREKNLFACTPILETRPADTNLSDLFD